MTRLRVATASMRARRPTTTPGAVRINDVPETLGARAYPADADLALEVTDPLNLAGGRFLRQIRDGVGKCHQGAPDVELGLAESATIYMGAHRASERYRAGRISEVRPGAVDDLETAFSAERAPFCGTLF